MIGKTPEGVRSLLARCLQEDPEQRRHHIVDARIEIPIRPDRVWEILKEKGV